ncbi:epoxide hydrolase [Kribbella sandramycini]|uniref:Epoxide hydrolase n=1 Tax=Kribbella sandramycini TaxID=60450 RepID=A0A7Y4P2I9_9ACTN|nr:epoxide hydrolase family protein [Kribbella sandramycini]MBB6567109.1 pimeloyl-ACP methyl ester carboxylesterase [Kribbella sandramycini]NOL44826.1 epoxide hydrolase [Kribbella sandramycini]
MDQFRIAVPDSELDDLRDRLRRARWPRQLPGDGWSRGVPVDYLWMLADRWLDFDWRTWEARLNAFPQFTTRIDEQLIHFLHVRSPEPDALPLVLTHGWPGSIAEFLPVLGPLTDPAAYGDDPRVAFHVVAPSVPGHGFSVPLESGWDHRRIARAWAELMAALGYDRYGAQGGDTGSVVSPWLGVLDPEHVIGVHLNGGLAFPDVLPADLPHLTEVERARLAAAEQLRAVGTGYAELQGTRPQTVSFGLSDSPIGQLAWIVEKFWEWTDPARPLPEDAVDVEHLLVDASIYWFTNTSGTSANLYYEGRAEPPHPKSAVPTGVAVFPTDPAIRRVLDRRHDITHWSEFTRGGHFAALEAPDLLVADIREFFRR